MEVMQILHMNKGNGETSYAQNSTVQSNIITHGRTIMDEALKKLMTTTINDNKTNIKFNKISIGIADLGCSSGPNSLLSVSNIVDTIYTLCPELGCPVPELRICLNDLPNNDFNYIFASLPEFYERFDKKEGSGICGPCFVSAVPGSFYGRLFPSRSLHFVHSSSSLHWLSQVPCGDDVDDKDGLMKTSLENKGKVYISKTSPESVHKAYALQFKVDFSSFLKSRSDELVPGGRMVLSFLGRNSSDPTTEESCYQWELLAQALMSLANEGKIEEEKIDSFNAPYYAASSEEIKDIIEKDGSFSIDRFEMNCIDWEGGIVCEESYELIRTKPEALASGLRVANTVRAVVEPMLKPKFGENVMDELFQRYAKIVGDYFYQNLPQYSSVVVSLIRTE